jgi:uncharacterized repeat protein (TIGR02543 family)
MKKNLTAGVVLVLAFSIPHVFAQTSQPVLVTSISVSGPSSVTAGGAIQMSATVSPSNATNQTVTWSVASIGGSASIGQGGLLTSVSAGTVTVMATANDGTGVIGSEQVTVNPTFIPATSISVSGGPATIGTPLQMSVTISPSDATNQTVSWSIAPGGTGMAVIDQSGLLTAQVPGTVTVVASANDGSGITGSTQVTLSFPTYTYASPTYTLTYTAGPGGSITGTSPQTVGQAASGTAVTAVPATGYQFMGWSDGTTVNPRTDTDVQGNVSVTANFSLIAAPAPTSTVTESLQAEVAQLQAQLVILLQELLASLQSQTTH